MILGIRERDLAIMAVLWVLATRGRSYARPEGGGPPPQLPPHGWALEPGFYWWFVRWSTDRPALEEWLKFNVGKAHVVKALGYVGSDTAILILKVNEQVVWTLPGLPTPAPNGPGTSVPELERVPPPDNARGAQEWRNFLHGIANQAIDSVLEMDASMQEWLRNLLGRR